MERDKGGSLWIRRCRLVTAREVIDPGEVRIAGGKIAFAGPEGEAGGAPGGEVLDAGGRFAAPGFIDLHVHGASGRDVLDADPQSLAAIACTCARFGVTGFLATSVFKPAGGNRHLEVVREAVEAAARFPGGAELLGLHLEGPFLAPARRGMIQPDCLAEPSPQALQEVLRIAGGALRLMTLAPELPGALEAIAGLTARGVVVSFGHSAADYGQTWQGIRAGIRHVTHLFNAMHPMHHREPGPIPALLEAEGVTAQVIFDGVHLHPAVLRLAARLLGPQRLALISDGTRAMGLPDGGAYEYDGVPFEARGGAARYRDGTLIGTTLGLSRMVERAVTLGGMSLPAAVQAASATPAGVLGLAHRKGRLEAGLDADLVLLDLDLTVWKTIRGGRIVYER